MAIKLGKNPKSFKKEVPVVTVDGVTDIVNVTYIYRTRLEFAQLLDERIADGEAALKAAEAAKASAPEGDDSGITTTQPPVSIKEGYLKATKESAETVLQVASGWDLDDPFTVENLQRLEDEFPGTLSDIQMVYQKAVMEHRRKN
ncbi:hypothetical protein HSX11_01720 [Oxalobacteraceae bacterium]|nr:hypothetical protein [Oxalobacteraceae bacterium]